MVRNLLRALALCALLTGAACESLTQSEKEVMRDLNYFQVDTELEYSRGTAMALNFLPGIGNFYLGQTGYGIANLLFWPLSIVWGMPQAWVDASVLNEKYTADYYRTRAGQLQMRSRLVAREVPPAEWPYWLKQTP